MKKSQNLMFYKAASDMVAEGLYLVGQSSSLTRCIGTHAAESALNGGETIQTSH